MTFILFGLIQIKLIIMKQICYFVSYSGGDYEDYYVQPVFITTNEEIAKAWVNKFNAKLPQWKEYCKDLEAKMSELKEPWHYNYELARKVDRIIEIYNASYQKIEFRN